jgi:predicted ribosomally synthesized peptide with SipW-like signal peptide
VSTETPNEDYVLVHKSKLGISRARKFIMGTMAVGAVAAIAGAGTFASFSASTTNDASFKTGTLILSDQVGSGNTCFSSKVDNTNSPSNDADLDTNDTTCDALFSANLLPNAQTPSVGSNIYTALVKVRNEGTTSGTLYAFAPSVCANAAGSAAGNEIQKLTVTATSGNFTLTYSSQTTASIAYNATAAQVDTALEDLSNIAAGDITVTKDGGNFVIAFVGALGGTNVSAISVNDVDLAGGTVTQSTVQEGAASLPSGTGASLGNTTVGGPCGRVKMQIQETSDSAGTTALGTCVYPNGGSSCPTDVTGYAAMKDFYAFGATNSNLGTIASGAERYFRVKIQMPTAVTSATGTCEAASTSTGAFGNATSDGKGCDNYLMNTRANMNLRWQLQG